MDSKPATKRSKRVVLTTLAAAGAVVVQGCGSDWDEEPSIDTTPFASLAECQASGTIPASTCQTAYNEALGNHEQAAPRFETQPLCEEEFGQGQCQPRVAGNSNYFIPVLAGFMVGRMLDRDNRNYYRYGGLYRSRRHNGWYSGGPYGGPLVRSGSSWRAGTSSFDRPITSPPVRSRSSANASRGGFGSRSHSSGSRGG